MMPARRAAALTLLLALPACGTVHDWQEVQTAPMTQGECYDGIEFVARGHGFLKDLSTSDRGLGTWQSRWRERQLGLGRPGRYRLVVELLAEEGSAATGWLVRFAIEQQKVKDLRRSTSPEEDDWSDAGQDREAEALFGEKLARRLGQKTLPSSRKPAS